jgi:hypothetical protein
LGWPRDASAAECQRNYETGHQGIIIHVTASCGNTKASKNNPDPDQWADHGHRTGDEMARAWMTVASSGEGA